MFSRLSEFGETAIRPGPDVQSAKEIEEFVTDTALTGYHSTCTCEMGDDDRLHVYGVTGLRVLDAWITSTITRGDTNAPTIAVAQRGADLIREIE